MKKIVLKFGLFIALGLTVTIFNSCEKDKNGKDENENTELKINFSNPQAVFLKNSSSFKSSKSNNLKKSELGDGATLFQLSENGDVLPVVEGAVVTSVKPFSYGLFVTVKNECYIIYFDNTYIKLSTDYIEFIGENEDGDLIFSDVSMIKKGSTELKEMQTALTNPRVQSMSGNFAVIVGNGIFQIYNTVDGERYNINGCNGPRIVALNKEKALINDCQENGLIDIKTGIRSNVDNQYVRSWNGECVYLKDGAVLMSQGFAPNFSGYGIGVVDIYGNVEVVCNDGFNSDSGDGACMNCGNENSVLFVSNNHYIVRELTQISVVKKGELTKKSILTGYNIINISVSGDKVFFIAEDNLGNKETGFYSLTTEEATLIITQEEFDSVYTF